MWLPGYTGFFLFIINDHIDSFVLHHSICFDVIFLMNREGPEGLHQENTTLFPRTKYSQENSCSLYCCLPKYTQSLFMQSGRMDSSETGSGDRRNQHFIIFIRTTQIHIMCNIIHYLHILQAFQNPSLKYMYIFWESFFRGNKV